VQVDVKGVPKQEIHEAQRMLRPWLLPDARLAPVLEIFEVVRLHVPRIRSDLGRRFLGLNVRRDVPVRAKHHRFHEVGKYGGRFPFEFLSHDHFHRRDVADGHTNHHIARTGRPFLGGIRSRAAVLVADHGEKHQAQREARAVSLRVQNA
jgi:hypothetical protein